MCRRWYVITVLIWSRSQAEAKQIVTAVILFTVIHNLEYSTAGN